MRRRDVGELVAALIIAGVVLAVGYRWGQGDISDYDAYKAGFVEGASWEYQFGVFDCLNGKGVADMHPEASEWKRAWQQCVDEGVVPVEERAYAAGFR